MGSRDPTRSAGLRRFGRGIVNRKVFELHGRLRDVIQEGDLVGLRRRDPIQLYFESDAARLERGEMVLRRVVGEALAMPPDWLRAVIERAVRRGADQAARELRTILTDPFDVARMHARETAVEIEGIAAETARRTLRFAARAIDGRKTPERLMRDVRESLRRVTRQRLLMLVNTAVVRAVNAGKLFGYEANGITQVGIEPEWVPTQHVHDARRKPRVDIETAGDDLVCADCDALAAGGPYTLDEARGLLPLHINCRCSVVPA